MVRPAEKAAEQAWDTLKSFFSGKTIQGPEIQRNPGRGAGGGLPTGQANGEKHSSARQIYVGSINVHGSGDPHAVAKHVKLALENLLSDGPGVMPAYG